MPARDPVDPDTRDERRLQIELETPAHDPGKKAAHRMRLPAGCFCQRSDGGSTGGAQHVDSDRLLRAGAVDSRGVFLPRLLGPRSLTR